MLEEPETKDPPGEEPEVADETALPDTLDRDGAPLTDTSAPEPGAEPEIPECPDAPADPIGPPDPVGIEAPLEEPNSPADDVGDPPR